MNFKPGIGKVLVKLIENVKTSTGGIILVDDAVEQANKAVVISIGDFAKTSEGVPIEIAVNVNDTILFNKGTGQKVQVNSEDFLVLLADDIYAIVEE